MNDTDRDALAEEIGFGTANAGMVLRSDWLKRYVAARVAAAHAESERRLELLRTVVAYDNANQSDLPLSLLDAIRAEVGGQL